ncbi:isopenicillin N synthase family oxygenase, partial [Acinetobacter baumannii]|nr:isopenicillin N synthase family oxygenase [Acinetobacter baumannii]
TYIQQVLKLGKHLAGLLALSLGLEENYFEVGYDEAVIITRMLHYPPQSEEIINNQLGCGAHTDWGLLTLLLQDEVGGLEVRNSEGEWIRAPHIPDTFIVNLGDLVQFMTNGLYLSNMHRVFNSKAGVSRYSVPSFFDLDYEYKIKRLQNLSDEFKAEPKEMTVGEYLAYMYQKTYAAKKEAV